ncbi:hypothetical protein COV20_05560 [Candidatus Woesearchaeota archaeon CG10_big_fil_rev_8_21_14_0_10_45_16]|nr:MAG: hypothetical protein COV20_05560 [Candidatus Woesearchaeota archaeon CG10_big_fil_rev_8_21_14_0_10_45_16]
MKYITAVLLVIGVLLAGCTVEQTQPQTAQPTAEMVDTSVTESGQVYQVIMESGQFMPRDLEIKAGDTVEWVNVDYREEQEFDDVESYEGFGNPDKMDDQNPEQGVHHTVTFNDGLVDVTLPTGGMVSHTFTEKGVYSYYDQYDPAVQGSIIVG